MFISDTYLAQERKAFRSIRPSYPTAYKYKIIDLNSQVKNYILIFYICMEKMVNEIKYYQGEGVKQVKWVGIFTKRIKMLTSYVLNNLFLSF